MTKEEIEGLKKNALNYTTFYIQGKLDGEKKYKDKIREFLKDLDEFDTTFFNASSLKEAIKNSLNELL